MTPNNSKVIYQKWLAVFSGAQRANEVLRIMKKATDINEEDQKRISAEARFLRAHYHFEAAKMWNKVPFINEDVNYNNGNYLVSNTQPIWPAIEADLDFAMKNLPAVQIAVGRANKYAAEAYLAKAFLFQKKWAEARPLLHDLIANGVTAGGLKYELINYADNFNPVTKNSAETIFSVQMSVNDGADGFNGNYSDILNFPYIFPYVYGGSCCGFFQPSQYLVNHFKTDKDSGLPDLDHFNEVSVKSDEGVESTDPFTPYEGTLDPRLDWTVGRRGIPYLDWGIHPGKAWIRDQSFSGPYTPKKNIYYQAQAGNLTEANYWLNGATANNVNLIRFSDVILWAAEAEMELGNFEQARKYINRIRGRAADPEGWVKNANGEPAANYKISEYTKPWTNQEFARKAVRFERTLELAMEGHRFFDLVRWDVADVEINKYLEEEKKRRHHLNDAVFMKNKHEYFPIPQPEIDLSTGADGVPRLKQNPGY
jgi:hypothetical protein